MDGKDVLRKVQEILWKTRQLFDPEITMKVFTKSQGNYVTSVDYSVEQYLKEELQLLLPEAGIVSEESDPQCRDINWVIDPIDGTGNMISGFPFAVSVALVDSNGRGLLGAVMDVSRDLLFCALSGAGAFVQALDKEPERIHVKKHLSNEGLCIFGMPYNREKAHGILAIAEKLYTISSDLKRIGPSSLDICAVAEGRAKMYVEQDLNPWDYAAGALILKEAGGTVDQRGDLMIFCESEEVRAKVQELL